MAGSHPAFGQSAIAPVADFDFDLTATDGTRHGNEGVTGTYYLYTAADPSGLYDVKVTLVGLRNADQPLVVYNPIMDKHYNTYENPFFTPNWTFNKTAAGSNTSLGNDGLTSSYNDVNGRLFGSASFVRRVCADPAPQAVRVGN